MSAYVRNYIRACEAYGWDGGPEFRTDIKEMANRSEKRNAEWSQSRFFTNLPFQNISQAACDSILDMFEDRMGRWGAFLYRNRLRWQVNNHIFGIGDGVTREFQLAYVSSVGGRQRRRNVYALYVPDPADPGEAVEADLTIRVNDTPTSSLDVDYDRGKVLFDEAPAMGAVLTWSGAFSHWVRFNQDQAPFTIDNYSASQYVMNGNIEIIEVNPPLPSELSSSS